MRVLRLPIFTRMLERLQECSGRRASLQVVTGWLDPEIRPEDTDMLDNLINWGRSAEIFAYDDNEEVIYLE